MTAAARDIISGNGDFGVYVSDPGTTGNIVEGDYIGIDVTGSIALGNGATDVVIVNGATGNTIGGTSAGAGDVISASVGIGLAIVGPGTDDNVAAGDYIGTDATGTHALGNGSGGVSIYGGAKGNTVGGTTAAARDVISGNVGPGVSLSDSGTTGNVVTGDYIGTAANGTGNLGNSGDGVLLIGVTGSLITNSLICYNGGFGIEGIGSNPTNNTITGDTFTVTIGSITYGNKKGATYYH